MPTVEPLSTLPALEPGSVEYAAEIAAFVTTLTARPDVVVAARSAADVAAAVAWAAASGRRVSVQTTGHQLLSDLAGTVLVSTRHLDSVTVDPARRTAVVGGGARWSQVIAAAAPHGLTPVCGSSSHVGVAGFVLGGGHGPLSRRHGVASDHVRRFRVVTADGVERDVDAEREPDLFWALRGGKSGFGIVTELEIELVALSTLYGGGIFFPGADAPALLHRWREWAPALPEDASTSIALLRLPPDPALPPFLQGAFVTHLRYAHLGDPADGERLLAPMREAAAPLADLVGEMPATAMDAIHSDPTEPMAVWDDSATLGSLPPEAVDALLAVAGPDVDVPLIMAELRLMGGAIARAPEGGDAVAGRDAALGVYSIAPMAPPVAAIAPAVAKSVVDALRPWAVGELPNFAGAVGGGRLAGCWEPATLARVLAVRDAHDPNGVFRAGLVHD